METLNVAIPNVVLIMLLEIETLLVVLSAFSKDNWIGYPLILFAEFSILLVSS